MFRDLRHAVRVLLKAKGWTAVVLVSLALGLGANTALFSAVDWLLVSPLPLDEPDELVRLRWTGENDAARNRTSSGYTGPGVSGSFSYAAFEAMRDANETLSGMFAATPTRDLNLVIDGVAEIGSGFAVSDGYFRTLRLPAATGRVLLPEDHAAGAEAVAVLSHRCWNTRFGGDAGVVGTVIQVNGTPTTIVGVLPAEFIGIARPTDEPPDLHLPLRALSQTGGRDRLSDATFWWLPVAGRLRPGVTADQVRGNLDGVLRATAGTVLSNLLDTLSPEARARVRNQNPTATPRLLVDSAARGLYDASPRSTRQATILGVVVVLVLLIVCANVATLLLSRAEGRRREVAVRLSVGATRGRLIRQLVTESLLLSAAGGALALPVAVAARRLLPFGQDAPFDWRVFGFAAVASLVVGLAFSLAPAFRATGLELTGALKEQSRSVAAGRTTLSRALLVGQVAASLALLVGAGLFLKTLGNLRQVDVGFNPANVLLFRINPTQSGYAEEELAPLYDRITDSLSALPGVEGVTVSQLALLSGSAWTSTVHAQGGVGEPLGMRMMTVSPSYFATIDIPLLAGRGFEPQDTAEGAGVAVINATAARELFGSDNPLGRRVGFSEEEPDELEVVGVVGDARYDEVRDAAPPTMFRSYRQLAIGGATFHMRTQGPPETFATAVGDTLRRIDPRLPVTGITAYTGEIEERMADERLYALAYSSFGGLATLLAAVGLFGLASYNVTRRTREIGIRMALGAQTATIARLALRESLVLVTAGVALGVLIVALAGRLAASLLYDIAPTDPATMLQAAAALLAVAALAVYLPVRRAARIDPLAALQDE